MEKKLRRKITSTLIILSFFITITHIPTVSSNPYTLELVTDPPEVEIIDLEALTGEGTYPSGCIIIDAKQTILSENVRYEFVQWSTEDNCNPDPEEDPPVLVGNQATIFMDSDRTVTAIYEPHYLMYLELETEPEEVEMVDPEALTGEGEGQVVAVRADTQIAG